MTEIDMWKVLGIEPSKDENVIRNAYRTKVVSVNPEDDPEGFKLLREAYEMAIASLNAPEEGADSSAEIPDEEKTEVDLFIDKAAEIYADLDKRINVSVWKELLSDPLCTELDTADEVREKLLAFCMGHFYLPHLVWKLFDDTFGITAEHANLVESFPEDYLNFVEFKAKSDDFFKYQYVIPRQQYLEIIDDDLNEIKLETKAGIFEPEVFDDPMDSYLKEGSYIHGYIDKILRPKYECYVRTEDELPPAEELLEEEKNSLEILKCVVEHLETFDIFHPLELAGKMRALYFDGRTDDALKIAREVTDGKIFEISDSYTYATAVYLQVFDRAFNSEKDYSGKEPLSIDKYEEIIDNLMENEGKSVMCLQTKGTLQMLKKDYEEACETIIKALDINSGNSEGVMLLKKTSSMLAKSYNEKIESGEATPKEKVDFAWSLFRQEKNEEVIEVLKNIEPDEETFYGYNNLYGRSYFNLKQYTLALPYLEKWVEMMDELYEKSKSGAEMSEKDVDRLKRRGFCYYLYAACLDELERYDECEKYYKLSVDVFEGCTNNQDLNEMLYYQENYGKMLLKNKRYPEAMEIWNSMIERVDHCIPAYVNRQETAFEMKDAQLVIDDYYNIIRDIPFYPRAYILAARVFAIYDQKDDVEGVLKRAQEAGVESDELNNIKARHLARQGMQEEAYELYKKVESRLDEEDCDIEDKVEFFSDVATMLMGIRNEDGERTHLKDALSYIDKGRAIEPNNKRLLWLLTDIYEWTSKETDKLYKDMLKLYPDDDNINYEYGEFLRRAERYEEAEKEYVRCLEKNPNHNNANNRLMAIYQDKYGLGENRDNYDIAVRYATRQLEITDDDYYRIERSLLYLDGYQFDEAYQDALKAIEMRDNNVYAHNAAGLALMKKTEFKKAIESFKKAIEVMEDKETPNPYVNLAKCYDSLEEYSNEIKTLTQAMDIFGKTSSMNESLARAYCKAGRYAESGRVYQELIDYYKNLLNETNNKWYELRVMKNTFRLVEIYRFAGNDQKAEELISGGITTYLDKKGYFFDGLNKMTHGPNRERIAEFFQELGNFYLFSERDLKKAIAYFRKSIMFWTPENPEKNTIKNAVLNLGNKNHFVRRPENYITDKDTLAKLARLYMCYATATYMSNDHSKSQKLANNGIECIIKGFGSIDNYLSFPAEFPFRNRIAAMLKYFQGDTLEAMKMLDKMCQTYRCSFCTHSICYEMYLMQGRMYEMSEDIPKAIECYKKSLELSPDDIEPYKALMILTGGSFKR